MALVVNIAEIHNAVMKFLIWPMPGNKNRADLLANRWSSRSGGTMLYLFCRKKRTSRVMLKLVKDGVGLRSWIKPWSLAHRRIVNTRGRTRRSSSPYMYRSSDM